MTTTKALLIPWDESVPVEEFEYDTERWSVIPEKITGLPTGLVESRTFPTQHTQLFYDEWPRPSDPADRTNVRAMKLWAHLCGVGLDDFRQTLVGNFVVMGINIEDGEAADVTAGVRYFFGEEGVSQE